MLARQLGKWFGLKTIYYNTSNGVALETWTDFNTDGNWVKTLSLVDLGEWPVAGSPNCGAGSQPVPITWGGHLCAFRSNNIESYDIKWASIRSIDASKRLAHVGVSYPSFSHISLFALVAAEIAIATCLIPARAV